MCNEVKLPNDTSFEWKSLYIMQSLIWPTVYLSIRKFDYSEIALYISLVNIQNFDVALQILSTGIKLTIYIIPLIIYIITWMLYSTSTCSHYNDHLFFNDYKPDIYIDVLDYSFIY